MPMPRVEYVSRSPAGLSPHPANPRIGDVAAIAASLESNGQYRPITVQRSTGYVLAGNHTLAAALSLGWDTIDVAVVDVTDDEARRILLADNRTADLGTYDNDLLLELLQSLAGDLDGTGWNEDDLEAWEHLLEPTDLDALAEDVGEVTEEDHLRRVVLMLPKDLAAAITKAAGDDHEAAARGWLGLD